MSFQLLDTGNIKGISLPLRRNVCNILIKGKKERKKEKRHNQTNKKKWKKKTKQSRVRLSWTGCERPPIHRCCPTTVWRGSFCLLCFHPGPVRSSLTNLENSDSSMFPILPPNLARTLDLHRTAAPSNPILKPFRDPSLQVTGLQAYSTTPGWSKQGKLTWCFVSLPRFDVTGTKSEHQTSGTHKNKMADKALRKYSISNWISLSFSDQNVQVGDNLVFPELERKLWCYYQGGDKSLFYSPKIP